RFSRIGSMRACAKAVPPSACIRPTSRRERNLQRGKQTAASNSESRRGALSAPHSHHNVKRHGERRKPPGMETLVTNRSVEAQLFTRVAWRLVPLLIAIFLTAYIDRANIGFAKLQMLTSLHMSEAS